MKTFLVLLTVTVVGSGGPPHRPGTHPIPPPLPNSTITVKQSGQGGEKVIAQSTNGKLSKRLHTGVYTLDAVLFDDPSKPSGTQCETTTIRLKKGQRKRHVYLWCSIL